MGIAVYFFGKCFWKFLILGNLKCAQETRWLRVAWWTRSFKIRSSNWIIPNTTHAQSIDYLRVGASIFCHAILTTRFPWVHVSVHHTKRSHRGSWAQVRLPKFPTKKTSQYSWLGQEISDWPCLRDLTVSWWISVRFFDAGEICELRLHTVTCLALLYVGKQHQTNNKPQNRVRWPWTESRLHRKSNNKFT